MYTEGSVHAFFCDRVGPSTGTSGSTMTETTQALIGPIEN